VGKEDNIKINPNEMGYEERIGFKKLRTGSTGELC
jgi:hypothetical protein